jgi:hypothetical protein
VCTRTRTSGNARHVDHRYFAAIARPRSHGFISIHTARQVAGIAVTRSKNAVYSSQCRCGSRQTGCTFNRHIPHILTSTQSRLIHNPPSIADYHASHHPRIGIPLIRNLQRCSRRGRRVPCHKLLDSCAQPAPIPWFLDREGRQLRLSHRIYISSQDSNIHSPSPAIEIDSRLLRHNSNSTSRIS